jgi:two-component system response regulator YesN
MATSSNHSSPHVRRMVALIEERFAENLSLHGLAAAIGRQEAYLGRLFREQMGVSMHEYLVSFRLARAESLIREGQKIESVALEVGYRSRRSFYRQFKRRYGTTPGAYRTTGGS